MASVSVCVRPWTFPAKMIVAPNSPMPRAKASTQPAVRPPAASGLIAGWVLAFARGVGEFGATIIFAGNVQGRTQTLTLAIYEQLESDLDVAVAISILLVVLSAGVLVSYKVLSAWTGSVPTSPHAFGPTS